MENNKNTIQTIETAILKLGDATNHLERALLELERENTSNVALIEEARQ